MTISEMLERLGADRGVRAGRATLWTFLDRHGLTFKKSAHAAEQDRPDVLKLDTSKNAVLTADLKGLLTIGQ